MQIVSTEMREKGINNIEWANREEWRRKNRIKTLGTERCAHIETLYTNK